jgi:hypothetical protein
MISKMRSEVMSRRRVFSILGLADALDFGAFPKVLTSSVAEAQMAGMGERQDRRTGRWRHHQGPPANQQAQPSERHSAPGRRKLALALQGGGSHGAFTWGVLSQSTLSA